VIRNGAGARLVVMANPDYFDPSLPRTAVQLIACEFDFLGAVDAGEPGPAQGGMMERLLRQFEYDGLNGTNVNGTNSGTNVRKTKGDGPR